MKQQELSQFYKIKKRDLDFLVDERKNLIQSIDYNRFILDEIDSSNVLNENLEDLENIESSLSKKLKNTLSELDKNEFIFHGNDDSITEVIMVCGRSEKENLSTGDISKISRINANKRLLSLANSYLDNLRQEARIVFK